MQYPNVRHGGRRAIRLALALSALLAAFTVSAVPQMRARIAGEVGANVGSSLERQMLAMLNRERTSRGLRPLVMDAELVELARSHSRDMIARRYFAHNTPDGKDPFDRFKAAGIQFWAAGENLALAPTLDIAHTGLMKSPDHRQNILHTAFGRVGIGIIDNGRRGLMISQEFKD